MQPKARKISFFTTTSTNKSGIWLIHFTMHDLHLMYAIDAQNIVIDPYDRSSLGTNSYDVHLSKFLACYVDEIISWASPDEHDDGITLLADVIRRHLAKGAALGMLMGRETAVRMPLRDVFALQKSLSGINFRDMTEVHRQAAAAAQRELQRIAQERGITAEAAFDLIESGALLAENATLRDVMRTYRAKGGEAAEVLREGLTDRPSGTSKDVKDVLQRGLGGSDENMESMVRFLINKYGKIESESLVEASEPVQYADTGLYHPDLKERITTDLKMLPRPQEVKGVVGVLLMRSYILSGDTKHYDAVIRALEEKGFFVIPAFAAGLDGRPAIESYFIEKDITQIDCLLSLTGFSLVGGPAYNDSSAAEDILRKLDVNYIAAHALEFQSIEN